MFKDKGLAKGKDPSFSIVAVSSASSTKEQKKGKGRGPCCIIIKFFPFRPTTTAKTFETTRLPTCHQKNVTASLFKRQTDVSELL